MKKNIRIFMMFVFALGIFCPASIARAQTVFVSPSQAEIVLLENGDYLETTIIETPVFLSGISTFSTAKTITKTKTTSYKNKSGATLWSVSIRATFTYNGSTSRCTSYSHSTTCPAKTWKIKSVTSSKKGNSATAIATATHSFNNISRDYTGIVTIKCSKSGNVS